MSQVEIVTKRGEKLGVIDDAEQTVTETPLWKERYAQARAKRATIAKESVTDEADRDVDRNPDEPAGE